MIDRTKTTHPLHKYIKLPKPHKLSLSLSLSLNLDKHKQKLMASMADRSIKREVNAMEAINNVSTKKEVNKGAWTAEEDRKLAEVIAIHGAKRWTTIATKAGLNRCGKSCRLRWLNYLRPNIKRGNISDQEEDLILRLHKLLGNRWSLIAGRLPGRTDNEIKNYWNSHLSKKLRQKEKQSVAATRDGYTVQENREEDKVNEEMSGEENTSKGVDDSKSDFDVDEFFDFSNESTLNLDWVSQFLELDQGFSDVS